MARKSINVVCPHCGKKESAQKHAISIFCKGCHKRIAIAAKNPRETAQKSSESSSYSIRSVVCPRCDSQNNVSVHALSAFCRNCRHVIPLRQESRDGMMNAGTVGEIEKRAVTCYNCSNRQDVPIDAMSAFCLKCGGHINLQDIEVSSDERIDILTAGDVMVSPEVHVSANIKGRNVTVGGEVVGNVSAEERFLITETGKLRGQIEARWIEMEKGSIFSGRLKPKSRGDAK